MKNYLQRKSLRNFDKSFGFLQYVQDENQGTTQIEGVIKNSVNTPLKQSMLFNSARFFTTPGKSTQQQTSMTGSTQQRQPIQKQQIGTLPEKPTQQYLTPKKIRRVNTEDQFINLVVPAENKIETSETEEKSLKYTMIKPVCLQLNDDIDENNNDLKGIFTDTEEVIDIDFDEKENNVLNSGEQNYQFESEIKFSNNLFQTLTPQKLKSSDLQIKLLNHEQKAFESQHYEGKIVGTSIDDNRKTKIMKLTRLKSEYEGKPVNQKFGLVYRLVHVRKSEKYQLIASKTSLRQKKYQKIDQKFEDQICFK